jgi:hypothetical protein
LEGRREFVSDEGFGRRAGTFVILVGALLLILFAASDAAGDADYLLFCGAVLLLIIGWLMRISGRSAEAPPNSGRFSIFRGTPKDKKEKSEDKS